MTLSAQEKSLIYEQYHDKVRGYIISKVNNADLADDLCSDIFLKIYEKLDTFDSGKASISTWIFTITRNRLTDYYRTRRVMGEIPEELAERGSLEEAVCNEEMLSMLTSALKKLEERERDIIVLRYYSGQTLKVIADRMGISYSYIKILHKKALSELKDYFSARGCTVNI